MRPYIYLIALAVITASCSTPKALEYRDFRNFKIEKLGFSTSTVRMDMIFFNPNNFGLQLKKTDVEIMINDVYLGRTTQEYKVDIEKRSNVSIPIQLQVDMRNLFKNSLNALFQKTVQLKVTGTVKVGKANVFLNIPVKHESPQTFRIL